MTRSLSTSTLATIAEVKATGKRWCSGCSSTAIAEGGRMKTKHRWVCAKCWAAHVARMKTRG